MTNIHCPFCQSLLNSGQDACFSCGASLGSGSSAPARHLPRGSLLHQDKFSVGRVLGEGGFGITYKGAHRDLRRLVAIKELFPTDLGAARLDTCVSVPATQADAFRRAQEHALQEAQAIAGFRSRSIVDVYDMFRENDTAYIVMEYLEGQTLEDWIQREGRVRPDMVLPIAQALCEALTEVHAGRLLHRDVKPANIVLTNDGRTVLIDFGSARAFQANRTQRHTRILTEKYAAPEQYLEEGRFGPYTDVFSLGATLYHALTGAPPPAAIDRLQGRRALAFPDAVPARIVAALQQALDLRVDDRLQSIAAFLDLITIGSAPTFSARTARTATVMPSSPDSDREALLSSTNSAIWADKTAWLNHASVATRHEDATEKAIEGLGDEDNVAREDYPMDTLLIRAENHTVYDVVRRISKNAIVMDPDFQRDFIWSPTQQSKLIESVLMRIPLPVFYLAEDDQGRAVMVDGLQRLITFKRFLDGDLRLILPDRNELNHKRFDDLPPKLQNRVEDCNLIFYLIDASVPERVRLDVFERVNGGVPLTRQQMRNGLFMGEATRFLKREVTTAIFLQATGGSLNVKTMRDREFVNRFCAFQLLMLEDYKGDMDAFLAQALRTMNQSSSEELACLSRAFRNSLAHNFMVFGKHAFRKRSLGQDKRNVLNASLWDVMSTGLTRYSKQQVETKIDDLRHGFDRLMNDDQFMDSITIGSSDVRKVRYRFQRSEAMFQETFDDRAD